MPRTLKDYGIKTGDIINSFTILVPFAGLDKRNNQLCIVKCKCGREVIRRTDVVVSGRSKKCEYCSGRSPELRNSNKIEDLVELALNRKWNQFRCSKHKPNITKEYWRELLFSICEICGEAGTIPLKVNRKEPIILDIKVNTIDRIDSNKGYIYGNVQTLCYDCNNQKNSHTQKKFNEIVNRVVDHQIKLRENNKPVDKINDVYSYSNQGYPHQHPGEEYNIDQETLKWIYLNETGL